MVIKNKFIQDFFILDKLPSYLDTIRINTNFCFLSLMVDFITKKGKKIAFFCILWYYLDRVNNLNNTYKERRYFFIYAFSLLLYHK